ncbi:MAG: 50S ribosomal protein L5 [Candidatus Peribacteraceae bacterium]|nr:50S ribosomal protein L5 [Candidatus Peribacteraceae bacterium]MDD5739453.1 50S ribosomal protein L5 [Candidatus Peribacteraceae bacterium]
MKKYESLHDRLRGPVAEALKKDLKVTNVHALPRIEKVTVNVGINREKMDTKESHEFVAQCLAKITGQKAVHTRSRKAISNFKIREGLVVGAIVTLHGRRMEEFLDRFLSYVLPRIRDFRGVTTKLDGHGNYAIGLKDHSIFPEVPPVDAGKIFGVQVQITTNAKTDAPARALLKYMGVPFRAERVTKKSSSAS